MHLCIRQFLVLHTIKLCKPNTNLYRTLKNIPIIGLFKVFQEHLTFSLKYIELLRASLRNLLIKS